MKVIYTTKIKIDPNKFPEIKFVSQEEYQKMFNIPTVRYRNRGDGTFEPVEEDLNENN